MLSTGLDYAYGFCVASSNRKKAKLFLWLSIINNLGILCVFKYYNFFIAQIQYAFEFIGVTTNPVFLNLALPIGISFYTFHGMSYVFDIYRGIQRPVKSFVDYAVFVSFFPLLVAGPIERANHLLPQVQKSRSFNYAQAVDGCRLILWGMFKKVVIADYLANTVDDLFQNYHNYDGFALLVGAIAFSFQIYGDFSGYSDIALGCAKLFGFELLSNFKFPYFSRNVAEFWRRWHISLSSWFRDYLYIPLGGSKSGKFKAIRNTFIIFLVSGFWHGASWNFLTWGFIHACGFLPLLIFNRNRKYVTDVVAQYKNVPRLKELGQIILTFIFVTVAWIFFRAEDMSGAIGYINQICLSVYNDPSQFLKLPTGKSTLIIILPLILGDWYLRRNDRNLKVPYNRIIRFFIYIILSLSIFIRFGTATKFIYFQF